MYPDPDPSDGATTASAGESDPQSKDGGDASESAETFLAPKSALGKSDYKVGDTCTFKIAHVYQDEVELEPADESGEPPESDSMEGAMNSLGAMGTEQG